MSWHNWSKRPSWILKLQRIEIAISYLFYNTHCIFSPIQHNNKSATIVTSTELYCMSLEFIVIIILLFHKWSTFPPHSLIMITYCQSTGACVSSNWCCKLATCPLCKIISHYFILCEQQKICAFGVFQRPETLLQIIVILYVAIVDL